ncbi:hypothetical protein [Mycobacterium intracellulare]|uniref:Uncharacterized protein n=1 Tax=Mycobacterium intracellulare subsp. chimaera TaxID=222805 RepID=A0ABT7P8L0_MYCIT|nr:hypothetical protein [Mycobacterium intracellulare]MDM3929630.1 hypothetical protein [Mycobacterium intracellulare subsp. chimaera]QGK48402.1 hypothetical protein GJE02_11735 [Mycobacterium intracellulare subsp. chimaera]
MDQAGDRTGRQQEFDDWQGPILQVKWIRQCQEWVAVALQVLERSRQPRKRIGTGFHGDASSI